MAKNSSPELMRGAVIGAGLIGARRALDFLVQDATRLDYVCDPNEERGQSLAARLQEMQRAPCHWLRSTEPLTSAGVDVAFVAAPHDQAAPIVTSLLGAGIDTLVEKPMGLNLAQARQLADLADRSAGRLGVGFNYRHYPAIVRAKEVLDEGGIGRPLFVRMILGHGGRPGYEQEWKLNAQRAGGGALLDPGIHLLDLARFFLGDVKAAQSRCRRLFWQADVEDVAVALLESDSGAQVLIQTSLIEWKNKLSIDVFGDRGSLSIEGRMGNYGPQRLIVGRRWAWLEHGSQAAGDHTETFGDEDTSYSTELRLVVEAFRSGSPLPADHRDGLAAMKLVDDLYQLAGQASSG